MPETASKKTSKKNTAKDEPGRVRSVNIPADVREDLRAEARARGVSMSALAREVMEDYTGGALEVPDQPGSQIVSTSLWVSSDLWDRFSRKSERAGHSTQWIFRTWMERHRQAE